MVIVHFVRHAQGYHNLDGPVEVSSRTVTRFLRGRCQRLTLRTVFRVLQALWQQLLWRLYAVLHVFLTGKPCSDPPPLAPSQHEDASLTALGWKQVAELRRSVEENGIRQRVELVVVSPLTRTLQTAAGVFGGDTHNHDAVDALLMVDGVGLCPHPPITRPEYPPFVALELCREHYGVILSEKRSPTSKCKLLFPGVDFSEVEDDEDMLWEPDVRESEDHVSARSRAFVKWLLSRKEKEIAVVSHAGFLGRLFTEIGDPRQSPFNNCELRTVVLEEF